MQSQGVAKVVEPQAMSQLPIEQRDQVTPGLVGAASFLHLGLPRQLRNQVVRNKIANLTQNSERGLRWLLLLVFLFHIRALWHGANQKPTLFSSKIPSGYGMAVKKFPVPMGVALSGIFSIWARSTIRRER